MGRPLAVVVMVTVGMLVVAVFMGVTVLMIVIVIVGMIMIAMVMMVAMGMTVLMIMMMVVIMGMAHLLTLDPGFTLAAAAYGTHQSTSSSLIRSSSPPVICN